MVEINEKLNKMVGFAEEKHAGQKRKNGDEYISHPIWVAVMLKDAGYDEDTVIAGLFHDLLEDTDATEDEILALAGPPVLEAVKLVTKTKDKSSKNYIADILKNPMAKAVKNADRIQNLTDACSSANASFVRRYLDNTKKYYVGKFSKELDEQYETLKKIVESKYNYAYDTSFYKEYAPIYRMSQDGKQAWVFNYFKKEWNEVNAYFWADLGDEIAPLSEEEVNRLIEPYMDSPEKVITGVSEKDRYMYGLVNGLGLEDIKKRLLEDIKNPEKNNKAPKVNDDPER